MGLDIRQFGLDKVFLHRDSVESALGKRVIALLSNDDITIVDDDQIAEAKGRLSPTQFDQSKKSLLITNFKGQFFKRCPGARPGLTCCNYFVLNLGQQCNFNCSYCYLQSFINSSMMKMYSNIDQALGELDQIGQDLKGSSLRVGTGEVIDSLSLDKISLFSVELIEFFRRYPKWRLEFKTKSNHVDQFLNTPHASNVIVSWSINPQAIVESEEHATASFEDRLAAAKKCRDKGFLISFHLDPMIWHPDWKKNYLEMVDRIVTEFKPQDIPVLSVGALRFQPEQRLLMRERFGGNSWVNRAEVFPSRDGKLRYDHSQRTEMFNTIRSAFIKHDPRWNIFMCMETPETWMGSEFNMPNSDAGLKEMFDHNLIRKVNQSQAFSETRSGS